MVEIDKGDQREIDDIALTRYAYYLIAQNGDSAKIEISFGQKREASMKVEPPIRGDVKFEYSIG